MKNQFKKFLGSALSLLPKNLKYRVYRQLVNIPSELPKNLIFKIAETQQELEGAFALLHDSYVDVGLMTPDLSGMRVTAYHTLPSSTTLIGKIGNEIVATVTIIRDSPMGLPSDTFVDLNHLRRGGDRIAEISALAIKKGYRGQLLLHLMKFLYETCTQFLGIDHLIATLTTDSRSNELYESILFFRPIEVKVETNYAFSNFRPVIAEHLNLTDAFDIFKNNYSNAPAKRNLFNFFTQQVLSCNQFPKRDYFNINFPVMDLANFKYFFIEKTSALKNMSVLQLDAARRVFKGLPQETFIIEQLAKHNIFPIEKEAFRTRYEVSQQISVATQSEILKLRLLDVSDNGFKLSSKTTVGDFVSFSIGGQESQQKILAMKVWADGTGVYGFKIIQKNTIWDEMIQIYNIKFAAPPANESRKRKLIGL